jgi:hypothetical protein
MPSRARRVNNAPVFRKIQVAVLRQNCISLADMGSLKKRRKAKINRHKRRKKLRMHRHKKRTWQA